YQHIDPALVGNDLRLLVSELAGRATVVLKGAEFGVNLSDDDALRVLDRVKELEHVGYTFEAADASFELLMRTETGQRKERFRLESFRSIVERREDGMVVAEATVKLWIGGERLIGTGEGNGPVDALDDAFRAAVGQRLPALAALHLEDYKVRILEGEHGTDAVTRVLVQTGDQGTEWDTVGVHENVIEASWMALEDAVTYGLLRRGYEPSPHDG
ncbi:MAG: citramalate synthase, partial [Actinobacteria bacterium]|nr:citramalate synthase [Actinomycetota bacterium]